LKERKSITKSKITILKHARFITLLDFSSVQVICISS
jgi:hypothetical protein